MNTYILLIVLSATIYLPKSFTLTEFQTKEACEIALKESYKFYKTVDYASKCISVKNEIEKQKAEKTLKKLEGEM